MVSFNFCDRVYRLETSATAFNAMSASKRNQAVLTFGKSPLIQAGVRHTSFSFDCAKSMICIQCSDSEVRIISLHPRLRTLESKEHWLLIDPSAAFEFEVPNRISRDVIGTSNSKAAPVR